MRRMPRAWLAWSVAASMWASAPAASADPSTECHVVDIEFTPTDNLQIVAWVEDTAGNYVDTAYITQAVGTYGLGNRPGNALFKSSYRWPYSRRPMVGQAPYVVNAGLTYSGEARGMSATLLYNVAGKRIVSAAERPLPDSYEMPRSVLDFSLRLPLRRAVDLKVDAENLLDTPFEVRQGDLVRERYRTGRSLGFGVALRQ